MERMISAEIWNNELERDIRYEGRVLFQVPTENTIWHDKMKSHHREVQLIKNEDLNYATCEEFVPAKDEIKRKRVSVEIQGQQLWLEPVSKFEAIITDQSFANVIHEINKSHPVINFDRKFGGIRVGLQSVLQFKLAFFECTEWVAYCTTVISGIKNLIIVKGGEIKHVFTEAKETVLVQWKHEGVRRNLFNTLVRSTYYGLTFSAIQRYESEGRFDTQGWSRDLIEWLREAVKSDEELHTKFVET